MHENLKYTIRLDQKIKEFISFDALRQNTIQAKEQIGDWQPVYCDIKYGTHYFLYAKFIGAKDGDEFVLEKIQLYIQNYSGPVSIGFNGYINLEPLEEMDNEDPDRDPRYKNRTKYYLNIGLEGLKMENKTQDYPKKDVEKLNVRLKQGDILVTQPFFSPVDPNLSQIYNSNNLNNSNFVDEIFMERVGEDIIITEEGQDALTLLYHLDLVSEENLSAAGIMMDSEHVKAKLSDFKMYEESSGITFHKAYGESKGITFACRPENSFFQIN